MGIQSFTPSSGGGNPALKFVGSIKLPTSARQWTRPGSAGNYALYSQNQESGYAYFVGSGATTGAPLNRLVTVNHSFTRIDILGSVDDVVTLYKGQMSNTSEWISPLSSLTTTSSTHTSSGTYSHPSTSLPLINAMLVAGGGGGGRHGGGGGGAGGIVKLTAYMATPTTSVVIGAAGLPHYLTPNTNWGGQGGRTFFGSVYANGGGGGAQHGQSGNNNPNNSYSSANGGGGGSHGTAGAGGTGLAQTSSTGLYVAEPLPTLGKSVDNRSALELAFETASGGWPVTPTFLGGSNGGTGDGGANGNGGGGGGAGGNGGNGGGDGSRGLGGVGHSSNISGSTVWYSVGGSGGQHGGGSPGTGNSWPQSNWSYQGFGMGGGGGAADQGGTTGSNAQGTYGGPGIVIVRRFNP